MMMNEKDDLHSAQVSCFLCGFWSPTLQSHDDRSDIKQQQLTKCEFCGLVWYCCQEHFEIHRKDGICFPFRINRSEKKGRYMIATRDIDPLEIILREDPAVVGPYSKSSLGCLQCFKKINGSYVCKSCHIPMCDEICAKGDLHKAECEFFRKRDMALIKKHGLIEDQRGKDNLSNELRTKLMERHDSSHICITPLRMLLKKENDPNTFAKINMLMDHMDSRTEAANNAVSVQLLKVVMILRESCSMEEFDYKEIQRMIGILKTNGMKLESHGDKGCPGVALYPIYCLINHACYNNTNYVKFPDLHLELRSQVPIKKGEEIFTRYISSTIGNIRRRDDILKYWFFHCDCPRCEDPTELGTFMSAVRCLSCDIGYLLPVVPLSYDSNWGCDQCEFITTHETIEEVITTIEKQIGSLEQADIGELEEMLFHYQKLLHPNHYILIDLMHNLVHLYAGKETLSRPEKERKVQLSLIVIETLGRVDPGFTKWRGTLLQELIHSLMMISKEDRNHKRITEKEFNRRLAFCSKKLKEAKLCLYGGFTSVKDYMSKQQNALKNNGSLQNN